jgi:hypothetical protein
MLCSDAYRRYFAFLLPCQSLTVRRLPHPFMPLRLPNSVLHEQHLSAFPSPYPSSQRPCATPHFSDFPVPATPVCLLPTLVFPVLQLLFRIVCTRNSRRCILSSHCTAILGDTLGSGCDSLPPDRGVGRGMRVPVGISRMPC